MTQREADLEEAKATFYAAWAVVASKPKTRAELDRAYARSLAALRHCRSLGYEPPDPALKENANRDN